MWDYTDSDDVESMVNMFEQQARKAGMDRKALIEWCKKALTCRADTEKSLILAALQVRENTGNCE